MTEPSRPKESTLQFTCTRFFYAGQSPDSQFRRQPRGAGMLSSTWQPGKPHRSDARLPDSTVRNQNPSTRILTIDRLRHGKQTVTRNRFDIDRSDLVLACFLRVKSISIGAVGEVFWADALQTGDHRPRRR